MQAQCKENESLSGVTITFKNVLTLMVRAYPPDTVWLSLTMKAPLSICCTRPIASSLVIVGRYQYGIRERTLLSTQSKQKSNLNRSLYTQCACETYVIVPQIKYGLQFSTYNIYKIGSAILLPWEGWLSCSDKTVCWFSYLEYYYSQTFSFVNPVINTVSSWTWAFNPIQHFCTIINISSSIFS